MRAEEIIDVTATNSIKLATCLIYLDINVDTTWEIIWSELFSAFGLAAQLCL